MNQTELKEPWRICDYCSKKLGRPVTFETSKEFMEHYNGKAWIIPGEKKEDDD